MNEQLSQFLRELKRFGEANDHCEADRPNRMLNITRDTRELLAVLARRTAARRVLGIGTSNRYSTLCLEATRESGRRFCLPAVFL